MGAMGSVIRRRHCGARGRRAEGMDSGLGQVRAEKVGG